MSLVIQKTNLLPFFFLISEICGTGLELEWASGVAGQRAGDPHYVMVNIWLNCCCLLVLKADHMPTKTTAIKEMNEYSIT